MFAGTGAFRVVCSGLSAGTLLGTGGGPGGAVGTITGQPAGMDKAFCTVCCVSSLWTARRSQGVLHLWKWRGTEVWGVQAGCHPASEELINVDTIPSECCWL